MLRIHHIFKGSSINTTPYIISIIQELARDLGVKISQHHFYIYKYAGHEQTYAQLPVRKITNILSMVKLIGKQDHNNRIILHGNPTSVMWEILAFTRMVQNVSWVCWGHGFKYKSRRDPFLILHYFSMKSIVNRLHSATINLQADYNYVCAVYGSSNVHKFSYYSPWMRKYLKSVPIHPSPRQKDNRINILLGTNGSQANNHMEGIKALLPISHLDVRVYCPLSYNISDYGYVQSVITEGRKQFGNKFVPITKVMNRDQYNRFLIKKIDCLVHASEKQQGLGTINTLVVLGRKVFLKSFGHVKMSMDMYGIITYSLDEISENDVSSRLNLQSINMNRAALFKHIWKDEQIVEHWKYLFAEKKSIL
jgi:dTDP-N-acetylfucosamine:lipid II N-acetylfucosaminyltransferase